MGFAVCNGAQMLCSFGTAPSALVVLSENKTMTSNMPMATIMDYKPMVNILPFAMCTSIANVSRYNRCLRCSYTSALCPCHISALDAGVSNSPCRK